MLYSKLENRCANRPDHPAKRLSNIKVEQDYIKPLVIRQIDSSTPRNGQRWAWYVLPVILMVTRLKPRPNERRT